MFYIYVVRCVLNPSPSTVRGERHIRFLGVGRVFREYVVPGSNIRYRESLESNASPCGLNHND